MLGNPNFAEVVAPMKQFGCQNYKYGLGERATAQCHYTHCDCSIVSHIPAQGERVEHLVEAKPFLAGVRELTGEDHGTDHVEYTSGDYEG